MRVLVVDDHPVVRAGVRQLIGSQPDMEVVGEAADRERKEGFISDLTLRPATGIPILIAVLAAVFLVLVFAGGALEGLLVGAYTDAARAPFDDFKAGLSSDLARGAAEGVYLSVEAMLALVIPYIVVFYIMLAVLEDTGYLVRVVSLLDGVMHRLGLHGRAVIPMVVGFGCNVPAILATRAMGSRRERLILATLITIAVPCSAQTAIIIGTVGNYAGAAWALAIYIILGAILVILGFAMHRTIKFEPTGLFVEIPDLRVPSPHEILRKTYLRVREFLTIAFPLLLVGSIALEMLMAEGILQQLIGPSEGFMMAVLGLPGVVVVAVDILPSELPREASVDFSRILKPFIPAIATADFSVPFEASSLPPEIKRAVITYRGQLTPDYAYIEQFLG